MLVGMNFKLNFPNLHMLHPLRPPHPNPTGLKDLPAPTQKLDPIFPNNSILNESTLT